jgi:hypothetical protein
MLIEHDSVVLSRDLPAYSLKCGDAGTIVLVHPPGGYEVEFAALDGEPIAVTSLAKKEVRATARREVAHARDTTPN